MNIKCTYAGETIYLAGIQANSVIGDYSMIYVDSNADVKLSIVSAEDINEILATNATHVDGVEI
jgi:hypothetical protein